MDMNKLQELNNRQRFALPESLLKHVTQSVDFRQVHRLVTSFERFTTGHSDPEKWEPTLPE